jgi:hypothetical protein
LPAVESFNQESLDNEEFLKKLHQVLLEIEVIEGELGKIKIKFYILDY